MVSFPWTSRSSHLPKPPIILISRKTSAIAKVRVIPCPVLLNLSHENEDQACKLRLQGNAQQVGHEESSRRRAQLRVRLKCWFAAEVRGRIRQH